MATPECTYMLGFSPRSGDLDGKLHHLKVTLEDQRKLSVQARRDYFAGASAEEPQRARKGASTAVFGENEADSKEVADALRQARPRPIMIAPGCTFDPARVPEANLQALADAVRDGS